MGHLFYKSRLIQEDMYNPQPSGMSSIAKKGAALLGVGAAGAMAHAGTFGTGAKNFIDGAGSAAGAMASNAGNNIGGAFNDTSKFYGGNGTTAPTAPENTYKHEVEQKAHDDYKTQQATQAPHDHHPDTPDMEDGPSWGSIGAVGALGLGALGLGKMGMRSTRQYQQSKAAGQSSQARPNSYAGMKTPNYKTVITPRLGTGPGRK